MRYVHSTRCVYTLMWCSSLLTKFYTTDDCYQCATTTKQTQKTKNKWNEPIFWMKLNWFKTYSSNRLCLHLGCCTMPQFHNWCAIITHCQAISTHTHKLDLNFPFLFLNFSIVFFPVWDEIITIAEHLFNFNWSVCVWGHCYSYMDI